MSCENREGRVKEWIVWDWNGTLFDDVRLSVECINRLLSRYHLNPFETLEQYREVFGFPVSEYYRRIGFDFDHIPFEVLAEEYMADYQERSMRCPLYPDALEVLSRCREWGYGLVLLSASRKDYLLRQVEVCGVSAYFDSVWGIENIYAAGKSGLARLLRGTLPEQDRLWFVGDSLHDAQAAQEVRADCILISAGHQSARQLRAAGVPVVESLPDALRLIHPDS